jgi:hypothetical protein
MRQPGAYEELQAIFVQLRERRARPALPYQRSAHALRWRLGCRPEVVLPRSTIASICCELA